MQYAGEIIYCRLAPRNLKRSLHALCLVEMTGEGEVGRDNKGISCSVKSDHQVGVLLVGVCATEKTH
jgi:hypothetical protein